MGSVSFIISVHLQGATLCKHRLAKCPSSTTSKNAEARDLLPLCPPTTQLVDGAGRECPDRCRCFSWSPRSAWGMQASRLSPPLRGPRFTKTALHILLHIPMPPTPTYRGRPRKNGKQADGFTFSTARSGGLSDSGSRDSPCRVWQEHCSPHVLTASAMPQVWPGECVTLNICLEHQPLANLRQFSLQLTGHMSGAFGTSCESSESVHGTWAAPLTVARSRPWESPHLALVPADMFCDNPHHKRDHGGISYWQ